MSRLVEATRMSRGMYSNNASGVCGVYWDKAAGKWSAQIYVNGKGKHLGLFADKEEAIKARKAAEKEYGFQPGHGLPRDKTAVLTADEVRRILHYNPETGALIWKVDGGGGIKAGEPAGTFGVGKAGKQKYQVSIKGRQYHTGRIAWLLHHGVWPTGYINFINGNRTDTRLENLREIATMAEVTKNLKRNSNNTSGVCGVCWAKARGKWSAQIRVDGKNKHLGRFTDKEEAIKARKDAEKEYGFHETHGMERDN